MKLVKEKLYESSGYSEDQMKQDYFSFIEDEHVNVKPEQAESFFNDVILPAFKLGDFQSVNDLYSLVSDKINSYLEIR